MIPYNPYIDLLCSIILAVVPIIVTYEGITLPPWIGLSFAVIQVAIGQVLKRMTTEQAAEKMVARTSRKKARKAANLDG